MYTHQHMYTPICVHTHMYTHIHTCTHLVLPHCYAGRLAYLSAHCTHPLSSLLKHTPSCCHTVMQTGLQTCTLTARTHARSHTHTCCCCHTVLQAGLPAWVLTAAAAATARGVEAREVVADSAPHTRLGEGQLAELSTCSSSRGAATRTGPQVPEELDARWQCYT